jgi:TonB family protein
MNTLTYLLQFNVFAILFYGFYLVFLQKETFHQPNRVFLVGSLLISLCVPVLTSDWLRGIFVSKTVENNIQEYYYNALTVTVISAKSKAFSLYQILSIIYGLGVIIFFIKFLFSLQTLRKILQKGTQTFSAFTFGRKTYIDSNLPEYVSIATHEQVHARQLHSADIIFMELLLVLNWFNPVLYFYEKAIKNIHEFLADEEAAKQLGPVAYARLLLSQEFGVNPSVFINLFYEKATLKQRITMLAKQKSQKSAILKYGLALPIFLGILIVSSAFVYKTDVLAKTDKLIKKQEVGIESFKPNEKAQIQTFKKDTISPNPISKKSEIKLIDKIPTNNAITYNINIKDEKKGSNNPKEIFISNSIKQDDQFKIVSNGIVGNNIPVSPINNQMPGSKNTHPKTFTLTAENFSRSEFRIMIDGKDASALDMNDLAGKIKTIEIDKTPVKKPNGVLASEGTLLISTNSNNLLNFSGITTTNENITQQDEPVFSAVQEQPEFPGGKTAMYKYLGENIVYPKEAQKSNIFGNVYLQFIVKKDGSVEKVELLKGLGHGCDEEAIRVIKAMPKWKPAKQNGKAVNAYINMPIQYKLD